MATVTGLLKPVQNPNFGFIAQEGGGRDVFIHKTRLGTYSFDDLIGRLLTVDTEDTADGKIAVLSIVDVGDLAAVATDRAPATPSRPTATADIFRGASPGQYLSRWTSISLRDHVSTISHADGTTSDRTYKSCLPDLHKMLLAGEEWDFASERDAGELRILENYLRFTFFRVYKQNRIAYSDNKAFAVFNTGLVDNLFEPIYAVFAPNNPSSKRPFMFKGFCCHGRGPLGKSIMAPFEYLPERAEFFSSINDVILPRDIEVVEQWEHIIDDAVARGRYPWKFLKKFVPDGCDITEDQIASGRIDDFGVNNVLKSLADQISETSNYREFKDKVESCIKTSLKRVEWNYKTAIPIFHPRQNSMSIALPLALFDSETADLALVLEKKNARTYYASTVLTLDQAYLSARLVCRPLSDWLTTNIGFTSSSLDD